ncbi:MAG: class I SAM-dependent methyltransferase [Spirochaetaceae bacterium]|nr:class I SAM-dependent methyltransferase [Spirochaetaceae bacterium]MCF7949137.1 class I SAM-dependent methyltransferase [Spirochaetia bacterium]MCF7951660.1 class I SAM-dependent methyltransferase [Spirochaetaceae bacterium]
MAEYSIAPFYDLLLYPFVHSLRLKLLQLCLEQNYSSILDVCCGTGQQLKILGKHGFEVYGVDLSEEMLRVSQKGPYAPECLLQDASAMSFSSDSFAASMTTFALHEKPKEIAQAIISEMIRVVQPGGHLIMTDFHFHNASSRYSKSLIRAIEWTAGGEHYRNFKDYISLGGVPQLIEGLPLVPVKTIAAGLNSIGIFVYEVTN